MLRLKLEAPCQQAMDWYFETSDNVKKYRGNQIMILPVKLHSDILRGNSRNYLAIKQYCMRQTVRA